MNIFVSGATGFIGSRLIMALAANGSTVHAIYRSKKKIENINHENIKWFEGDILNIESLEKAMEGCEQVYHLAAFAAVWENNPGDFTRYNVQGTINILDVSKKSGVKSIVVTSTAGVFGPSINSIISESSVSEVPLFTGYERTKAESERIILDRVKNGEKIIIVNPTRVFGPGPLNESNSVTKMIKQYLKGKWHFLPGNGESIGNYAFVDDVVNGHILAMQRGKAGEKYILGGENTSYKGLFEKISEISGKKQSLYNVPMPLMLAVGHFAVGLYNTLKIRPFITPSHIKKFNYNWETDIRKAQIELGYKVTTINDALNKTIKWIESGT
jgi:farnesol dehydrogenase